jgi:hypothetical protein
MEDKDKQGLPAGVQRLIDEAAQFQDLGQRSLVTDEQIAQAESKRLDPFAYGKWDKTWAGTFAKLTEFYWPMIVTMVGTALMILVVQGMSWFLLLGQGALALGWWCVLPVGLGVMIAASWQHSHMRDQYSNYIEAEKQLTDLRERQLRQYLSAIVGYHNDRGAALDRRVHDLREALRKAVERPDGVPVLRPADQAAALDAVWAVIKNEPLPDVVATVSRAEYGQFYMERQEMDPRKYQAMVRDLDWYTKNWPLLGEQLRQTIQRLWESRREGSDPPSAKARRELVMLVRDFWGKDSYPWRFLRDLGATDGVPNE